MLRVTASFFLIIAAASCCKQSSDCETDEICFRANCTPKPTAILQVCLNDSDCLSFTNGSSCLNSYCVCGDNWTEVSGICESPGQSSHKRLVVASPVIIVVVIVLVLWFGTVGSEEIRKKRNQLPKRLSLWPKFSDRPKSQNVPMGVMNDSPHGATGTDDQRISFPAPQPGFLSSFTYEKQQPDHLSSLESL